MDASGPAVLLENDVAEGSPGTIFGSAAREALP
jgi:hypothetical protein